METKKTELIHITFTKNELWQIYVDIDNIISKGINPEKATIDFKNEIEEVLK